MFCCLRPARRSGVGKTKSSPGHENFSAVSPPPRWQFALFFVSFLSGGVRSRTPRRWPPPSSTVLLLGLSPVKCTAAPKVASRRRHQVELRSQPPRAAKCQRGLSAAGVFGFSSFAGPRWGCSQIAPLLQHWGPLSGPGRLPAAPEATGALCTGSGLGERRVRSAPPSLRTVWLPPPLGSSRRPLPAGAAVVAVLGSSALGGRRRARGGEPRALRRKRGRSPENAGDFLARSTPSNTISLEVAFTSWPALQGKLSCLFGSVDLT
ncbi:uncharacterized protein [Odocoileus virginianus]|uniref:Uncharacterized protein n=1 Tax=Odocoileus virginianus TaxID=9874 RepID=A0ABM4IIG6_ODOVR